MEYLLLKMTKNNYIIFLAKFQPIGNEIKRKRNNNETEMEQC